MPLGYQATGDVTKIRSSGGLIRTERQLLKGIVVRAIAELQISAFLLNKPGVVAHICGKLTERGVNIRAFTVLDTADVGTIRMIVDNLELAQDVLRHDGAAYVENPVICVPIPNKPGSFAKIAQTMAENDVNIEYVYATVMPGTENTLGVFRVSDHKRALELEFEV